jgi:catechol 2,3-dioxygenase-like lactoylglutathione lyase family enzyme
MEDFYQRALGFVVTDADHDPDGKRRATFLSRDPSEHHQFVLVSRPAVVATNTLIQQISFRAETLAEVRRVYFALRAERLSQIDPITHGTAWSVYFRDPEENRMEVYTATPWYITQPFSASIDYNKSDDVIRRETEELCRSKPSFRPMADWQQEISSAMLQAVEAFPERC